MMLDQMKETALSLSQIFVRSKHRVDLLFTEKAFPVLSYENVEVLLLCGFHAFPHTVPAWKATMFDRLSCWYGIGSWPRHRLNSWLLTASIIASIDFEYINDVEVAEVRVAHRRPVRYWRHLIRETRMTVLRL